MDVCAGVEVLERNALAQLLSVAIEKAVHQVQINVDGVIHDHLAR